MRLPYALLGAILGAAAAPPPPSAASFYVPALPGLHGAPAALQLWAGHLPADTAGAPEGPHLYFVLTKARRTADKERVIFWFNGGPGCSSFDGLMMEVGPWRVDGHGGLRFAEGGWEEYALVVYGGDLACVMSMSLMRRAVDQPAGTGYSYTSTDKYVHELTDAAGQLLEFLDRFYAVFPELRHADTYLAGEVRSPPGSPPARVETDGWAQSFAGQYIPYFADAVLNSTLGVPLRGVAIGNGWIDGRRQYPAYLEYALKHDLVKEGTPVRAVPFPVRSGRRLMTSAGL
jgi:carboxypeptidase D